VKHPADRGILWVHLPLSLPFYHWKMNGAFDKWANLRAEIEQLCLDFIRTELETCRAFANLAATEHQIGDREAAGHCTRESEKAYHTVIRSLSRVTCAEERREYETKLRGLRETLDDLHQRIAK
jgi:hypothetical protein